MMNNNIKISAARGLLALRNQSRSTQPSYFYSYTLALQYNHIVRHSSGYQVNNRLAHRLINLSPYTQHPRLHHPRPQHPRPQHPRLHHSRIQPNAAIKKHTSSTARFLPSINEMLSGVPTPAQRGRFILYRPKVVRSTAIHQQPRKREVNPYQVQQHQNDTQIKQQCDQQQLPVQDSQQILNNIKSLGEDALDFLFQGLKRHYLKKYEKVLILKELEAVQIELDDDDSADDSSHTVSDSVNESTKKPAGRRETIKNNDKPRWTQEEKAALFEAVVRHKSLNVMHTFDWGAIGADIGQGDKACKDQWRRGVLQKLRDSLFNQL